MSQITDKWIDDHEKEIIESLQAILRIRSVEDAPCGEGKPFGEKVREVEDCMINIAKTQGLSAKDCDGYYCVVDAGEEKGIDKEMLGIVCHLDVVPEGTGWSEPPFAANIVNGSTIVARGTVDDKGPAMASLFALKAVIESGYRFNRQVRLILGLNEETGMGCIERYLKVDRVPDITFTPDGSFPLANSEFGICQAVFRKSYKSGIVFNAGSAPNIVPAEATATAGGKAFRTEGIQCHASTPWEGENAAQKMIAKLAAEAELAGEDKQVIEVLNRHLGSGYYGEGFGLEFEDVTGKQTMNLGIVKWDENGFEITLDLRCPNAVKQETVKEKLTAAFAECGAELAGWFFSDGYYLSEETEIVSKLMKVYQDRTGDTKSKPLTMGGGTYARHFPNAVSFGPEGVMDMSTCHVPMERITFEQLNFLTKIIADAIISIACEPDAGQK